LEAFQFQPSKVLKDTTSEKAGNNLDIIPTSNRTVYRCTDEMAVNDEKELTYFYYDYKHVTFLPHTLTIQQMWKFTSLLTYVKFIFGETIGHVGAFCFANFCFHQLPAKKCFYF
jgi:hypothetical protein